MHSTFAAGFLCLLNHLNVKSYFPRIYYYMKEASRMDGLATATGGSVSSVVAMPHPGAWLEEDEDAKDIRETDLYSGNGSGELNGSLGVLNTNLSLDTMGLFLMAICGMTTFSVYITASPGRSLC